MTRFATMDQFQKDLHRQEWPICKDCENNMVVSESKTLSNKVFAVLFKCNGCGKSTVRHGPEWERRLAK